MWREPWTKDEVVVALQAMEESPIGPMVTLLLATGMRLGEAQGLLWSDINMDTGALSIERTSLSHLSLLQTDGRTVHAVSVRPPKALISQESANNSIGAAGNRGAERAQGRDNRCLHPISERIGSRRVRVFTNVNGGPVSASNFRRKYAKGLRDNGLRFVRINDLRHTFITLLAEQSPHLLIPASRAAGHSSVKITADRYAKTARIADEQRGP